jgi:type II secretory pathway pseudopilin PulG
MAITKLKLFKRPRKGGEKGIGLIEVLVALAIVGVVSVAILSAIIVSHRTASQTDTRETAKNLAESQMEYIKGRTYIPGATQYDPMVIPVEQRDTYTAQIAVSAVPNRDANIQKIRITISGPGITYILEDYKVNTSILGQ